MNEELRRRYVRDLITDLGQVGGARLEQWIKPLWDHVGGAPVNARGVNPEGTPVSGALDAMWPDGSVSEASSDASYFTSPYKKPRHDFRHALQEVPGVRIIRLFSNRLAGPTVTMRAERIKRRLSQLGFTLDIWDGQRIAEYIVDKLLLDDRYVERVGDALPNLRRIAEQSAANARIPDLDPLFGGRDEEERAVVERLQSEKCLVLSGLGGIGKTELACAVAHRARGRFELVIWVDAAALESERDLKAFDVRLNGYKLNLLNLLGDASTLLVLDNLKVDLDLSRLAAHCGDNSRVLITSQVEFGGAVCPISFVGRDRAIQILSQGMNDECPAGIVDEIINTVEGHPLVLRMLNGVAVRNGWSAVSRQCRYMAGVADERRRTVASRILEQHREVLGCELAFFAWCRTAIVDRGLFEQVFGPQALHKLERWAVTARGQSDAVRLHDIVYQCVERIQTSLPFDMDGWEMGLEEYLSGQLFPKRLGFFRVVNRHGPLLERLLRGNPRPGAIRYGYLHAHLPARLDPSLMGDPIVDATHAPDRQPIVWLLSIVEAIEADYRRLRALGEKEAARTLLESRLIVFDTLRGRTDLPFAGQTIAQHHKAKSLVKLGRAHDALSIFETLINEPVVQYAAKLQIARLSQSDPGRAKQLIFEIIEAEQKQAGQVPTSVLLETLATLRRPHLRNTLLEITERFGTFMAQQIKAAACSGEDLPIHAFAAVGSEWSYHQPELFLSVLDDIDLGGAADAEDDDERIAIGRLLKEAGKLAVRRGQPVQARRRFEQAESFFSSVQRLSGFVCTQYGDVLLCLERGAEAGQVLDQAPEHQREAFWLLRRSEAHLAVGDIEPALDRINEALARPDLDERRPTFLAHRAEVLFSVGNPEYLTTLEEAISICAEGRYRNELQRRLDIMRISSA